LAVIFGQVVTERNVSLLLSDEFHSDLYDARLPVEEKGVQYFRLSLSLKTAIAETFSLDSSTT
jgi:hypothetical protein